MRARGLAADQVGGDRRRVGHGLLQVPNRLRQQLEHVRLEDVLEVLGLEQRRNAAGVDEIVGDDLVAEVLLVEADGVRADALLPSLGHRGNDRRRVDTAAEERAERDVADHLAAHRPRDGVRDLVAPLASGRLSGANCMSQYWCGANDVASAQA